MKNPGDIGGDIPLEVSVAEQSGRGIEDGAACPEVRKSRRSGKVQLGVVAAVAALTVAGCASGNRVTQQRRCVDANGRVLPDSACGGGGGSSYGGYGASYPHYVYGGSVYSSTRQGRYLSGPSELGGYVRGAASAPAPGATVVSRTGGVVRGGFGGSGGGFFGRLFGGG